VDLNYGVPHADCSKHLPLSPFDVRLPVVAPGKIAPSMREYWADAETE
jgi:hypothetical protein